MKVLFWLLPALFLTSGSCFAQSGSPFSGSGGGPLKVCPKSPNCVSSQAGDSGHAVAPLVYTGSRAEACAKLKKVLTEMTRMKIVEEKDDYLHAEARSLIFRFVDDVEFYLPAPEKVIHVRSASRVGYSDMGVNRKRVEEIRRRFVK
ncbi:MAG: DUF1499 domain-containing protein [Deltaproteobacteria bacterium HGW-Deltaproteobacteria-6]|jgi:uncharacterized protein (DUF1499 family)|nr:MAG: DUF1499 domain-containing protein [Deltaproteobacteria bacterium HGW-Deltaproteobacteria-6]